MSEIGDAIKEIREHLGNISQERFARRLGTTSRTIARWEASESLSPQILSRLRSIAAGCGADGTAEFFEEKLREDLDLGPDESFSDDSGDITPGTPEERELVAAILTRYRAEDPIVIGWAEQLRADAVEEELKAEAAMRAMRVADALAKRQKKPTLADLVSKKVAEIKKADKERQEKGDK